MDYPVKPGNDDGMGKIAHRQISKTHQPDFARLTQVIMQVFEAFSVLLR